MHILISPNAFKNSLDAGAAAIAIQDGLLQSRLSCTSCCFPIGDGGDGTGDLLIRACSGSVATVRVSDPLGREINASYGFIEGGSVAVIEMASASGLRLLHPGEKDPLRASSYGTGQLIIDALNTGATKIILCVGGSATVDAGAGIMQALGARFLDANGAELKIIPEELVHLASIDISGLDKRLRQCECTILCDVTNPLLGAKGAATIFGPQKGASEKQVLQLEAAVFQFAQIALTATGKDVAGIPHGGAAGGAAAGLHALVGARLVNGIDYFLDITGFDMALQKADLVITGEGSIDLQTLDGKGPYGVAVRARRQHVPVVGLAGSVPLSRYPELDACFNMLLAIGHAPADLPTAMLSTADDLTRTARQLGNLLYLSQSK